jgi:diguanylate cyclase (GGDEF)-like protein
VDVFEEPPAGALEAALAPGGVRSVFQPIVDLDSGRVVAYEALARGPRGPLERPDLLFAAARAAGRLAELDEICRAAAFRGAVEQGLLAPLTVFVNVEPEVLDSAPLDDLLAIAGGAPGTLRIVLEITERALASRPAELLRTVERVRSLGWGVAVDDVGADSMSLAFLPLLAPDVIKLDLSLVQDRPNPAVAEIMNAVNAHAERTGALILAEGIETEAHLATARALGATLGQGWYFGRPGAGAVPGRTTGELTLTGGPAAAPVDASPFSCLPAGVPLRRSAKSLLIEFSKQLEREAMRLGETCVVAAAFQEARHFTPSTVQRYRDLVERTGFVCALGEDLPVEPLPGVRGAALDPADPVRGEWDVVVLSPHFSAALLAHDLGDGGPDLSRTFEYALTYDRDTVIAAAHALLTRVVPRSGVPVPPAAAGQRPTMVPAPLPAAPAERALLHERDRHRAALSRLQELTATDPLTGLPGRGRLEEQVEIAIWNARGGSDTLALLVLGLDRFRAINEGFGHAGGDEFLQTIARTLRSRLRHGDLLARLGGDEFVVALTGLEPDGAAAEARRVADQLAAIVGEPVVLGNREVTVGASVGVAVHPADGVDVAALLHRADADMYARKTASRRVPVQRR